MVPPPPQVYQALAQGAVLLAQHGVDSPRLNAELLLAHTLKTQRLPLLLDSQRVLSDSDSERFNSLLEQRARRIPLQHLTGSCNFLGHELRISRHALVPRPETEGLVEHTLTVARSIPNPRILDFATGSGCIAIALAHQLPNAQIHALDLSAPALELAQANATLNGLSERIQFHQGNGFNALPSTLAASFDVIVSNPPYIPSGDIPSLDPEVRDHDPLLALDGGADGLDFYRRLAVDCPNWLRQPAWFLAEFGDDQGPAIQELFQSRKFWGKTRLEKDLSGRDRIIIVGGGNRSTAVT